MTSALDKAKEVGSQRGLSLCYHALGAVQYLLGEWQESVASYQQSIDLGRQVGGLFGVVLGSQRLALVETKMGLYERAHGRLLEALETVRNTDDGLVRLHSMTRILGTLAQNRLEAGGLAQAVSYVAQGWEAQKASGECIPCDVSLYPTSIPIYLALGDWDGAAWATKRAEETAANFGSKAWSATAVYVRGLLAKSTGDMAQASRCFHQSLGLFETLGQPYDSALSKEGITDTGSQADPVVPPDLARSLLEQVAGVYRQLGATSDEKRARSKLAELGS